MFAVGKAFANTAEGIINPQGSAHFAPSNAPFMVDHRVVDSEGDKVELWEPQAGQ